MMSLFIMAIFIAKNIYADTLILAGKSAKAFGVTIQNKTTFPMRSSAPNLPPIILEFSDSKYFDNCDSTCLGNSTFTTTTRNFELGFSTATANGKKWITCSFQYSIAYDPSNFSTTLTTSKATSSDPSIISCTAIAQPVDNSTWGEFVITINKS